MEKLLDEAFVQREMTHWNIPGFAIAVCYQGQVLAEQGYGFRSLERGEPVTPFTLFDIASCSKSFTAAVLASLVDEGTLEFDRPILEYLPDFRMMDPVATAQVTVRDMLYHRTGVAGHDALWPDPSIDRKEYLRRIAFLRPNKPFRSATQYSNVMYGALGAIAEQITGKTWENLVQERILTPLGMARTCLTVREMRRDPDYAVGYFERIRGGALSPMPPWEMDVGAPAAGVNSCVHEMMHWVMLHLNNGVWQGRRLFSEHVMEQMHRGAVEKPGFRWVCAEVPACSAYGMGWKTAIYRGMRFVFHTGEIEGYGSIQILLPDRDLGLVLMVNKHEPFEAFVCTMAYTVIDRVLGLPPIDWAGRLHPFDDPMGKAQGDWNVNLLPQPPVPGTRPSHAPEACAGEYRNPAYGPASVTCRDGGLTLHYKAWDFPLEHYHYDTFRVRELKEDTKFITMPLTWHYCETTGAIDGFFLKLEPELESEFFRREG